MLENVKVIQQCPLSNKQLIKKCNQIWKRVKKLLKIGFDSEPIYGDNNKCIKTKIKIYPGSIITSFQSKKKPKEKAPCKCLLIIMLDSVIKAKGKYYPQTFLEERKYEQEKIKMQNLIDDDLTDSKSVSSLESNVLIPMMKQNLIMMNLMNNLLNAEKLF